MRKRRLPAATAAVGSLAGVLGLLTMPTLASAAPHAARTHHGGCHLHNGIKHVVQIVFDNVHFFRDNPNVPSDLQLMPNLLRFIQGHGTLLSNNHTPLIAHTANDILTTFTGLYGDRHGMPIANGYQAYNKNGTSDPAESFAYWTDPVFDTASPPSPGHDTNPSMVYSPVPPATAPKPVAPNTIAPAPWVPYTRAGCDVGVVAAANVDLENTAIDIPKVFGPTSPEAMQLAKDPNPFKDAENADYIGVAVHCARRSAFCATARAVKFGQNKPSPTAVTDVLPNEPGGYAGFQALFGHRYVAPQLGAGTPNLKHNGFAVTNSAGNLVDLAGNEMDGAFLTGHPGFPGFGDITPQQTLAYAADMLETGVPVVTGYISDLHGNHGIAGLSACSTATGALGSGSACYIQQAQYYNSAFATFFKRLAADGITTANTLFVFSTDEGDHVSEANVGRALVPTPAGCDGAKVIGTTVKPDVLCTYPTGTFGELSGNLTGLLATQAHNTTPVGLKEDSAPEFSVNGNPSSTALAVRALEHDVARLTVPNPYVGHAVRLTNYLADPTEEAILHMVNADPARTPTFAMFARPDYFLVTGPANCSTPCVSQTTDFAYEHGDYAAEINTNWLGIAGPGVARLGVDGTAAAAGPNSAGPNSGQVTVPASGTKGPWLDETDIRPTILYLTGLRDDYLSDGRVVTQILTNPNEALTDPGVTALGECYKQLNSSVGQFGTFTLQADTKAVESHSTSDRVYLRTVRALRRLEIARDRLAGIIKRALGAAAFSDVHIGNVASRLAACRALIGSARRLAG